jgi:hypothetical protein
VAVHACGSGIAIRSTSSALLAAGESSTPTAPLLAQQLGTLSVNMAKDLVSQVTSNLEYLALQKAVVEEAAFAEVVRTHQAC